MFSERTDRLVTVLGVAVMVLLWVLALLWAIPRLAVQLT